MTDKSYETSREIPKEEKKSKSNRVWKILVIILLILLLFVVTTGVIIFVPLVHEAYGPSSGVGMSTDPFAGEFVNPNHNKEPQVSIPGWFSITIPANTDIVKTVTLSNPNDGYYDLTFKLSLLDENGEISETLYESGLLPPREYIQTITLSRGLAPGEYDAVMEVQPYRIKDQTQTNSANSKLTLIVE